MCVILCKCLVVILLNLFEVNSRLNSVRAFAAFSMLLFCVVLYFFCVFFFCMCVVNLVMYFCSIVFFVCSILSLFFASFVLTYVVINASSYFVVFVVFVYVFVFVFSVLIFGIFV